jgi:hypothetical protein
VFLTSQSLKLPVFCVYCPDKNGSKKKITMYTQWCHSAGSPEPVVKIHRVRPTACWIYLGRPYVEGRIGCWSPRNLSECVSGNTSLISFKCWYHSAQPIFKCNRNLNGFIIWSSESNLICALWNTCYNIPFTLPHDALLSALFFCDQRHTTEREKIHLQQSQSCCMVIFKQFLQIFIYFFTWLCY